MTSGVCSHRTFLWNTVTHSYGFCGNIETSGPTVSPLSGTVGSSPYNSSQVPPLIRPVVSASHTHSWNRSVNFWISGYWKGSSNQAIAPGARPHSLCPNPMGVDSVSWLITGF